MATCKVLQSSDKSKNYGGVGCDLGRLDPGSDTHHPVCCIIFALFQLLIHGQQGRFALIRHIVNKALFSPLAIWIVAPAPQGNLFTVASVSHAEVQSFERVRIQVFA
jgi:hypothetical protein